MKVGIAFSFLIAIIIGLSYLMAMERFWTVYVLIVFVFKLNCNVACVLFLVFNNVL